MKKKKTLALLTFLALLIIMTTPALALPDSGFTDIDGHWAKDTLLRAYSDELVCGFEDSTLRPDEPITASQMITVLCRVLNVPETFSSPSSVPAEAWYFKDAGKAAALGLISPEQTDLDSPMTRQDAMAMLAKAFSLVPAEAPLSSLESFSDSLNLTAENRAAVAQLVYRGYIHGFGSELNVNSGITRGEFFAVLYRIAENYIPVSSLNSKTTGGSVIKESGSLAGLTLADDLWFDCSVDTVSLKNVTAGNVTVLSRSPAKLELSRATLSSLVIAGNAERLAIPSDSTIGTLRFEGKVSSEIGENVKSLELTGSDSAVAITGEHETVVVGGSGNYLTFNEKSGAKRLVLSGSGNTVSILPDCSVDEVIVTGKDNSLSSFTNGSTVKTVSMTGSGNELRINGEISESVSILGEYNTLSLTSEAPLKTASVEGYANWLTLTCTDMERITAGGRYNTVHKCVSGTVSSIDVPGENSAFHLYVGNSATNVFVTGEGNSLVFNGSAQNVTIDGRGSNLSGEGRAENVTLNASGCNITVATGTLTDNGFSKDADRVLALVTSKYAGNFTLKWAEEHDYENYDKEVFVNANGYTSETGYLIWISKAMQRVNIFEGSKENWKLTYSCIVGTGATNSQTPDGVYFTTYKLASGWTTATYTCRPVVGFKAGSGYAFHSRLYYPRSNTLTDAKIGFPVSHGCVRMYDKDIYYIYDNIPLNTTVVVY